MITTSHTCSNFGSENIVRNGNNKSGSPTYHCKNCKAYRVFKKSKRVSYFKTTEEEATEQSVLEVDEIFSFVIIRGNQIQIWVTENATTKQIVYFFIRDGSIESCKKLWCKLPYSYLRATSFSDF